MGEAHHLFEIRHYEKCFPEPARSGWLIFVTDWDRGTETYVDHDWHKGCLYIPAFPPPLWGFFPSYLEAAKAIDALGWADRILERAPR